MNQVKILFIDDDKITSLSMSKELESEGYQVTIADNGEEALGLLEKQVFDLIVLDLIMPGLGGLEIFTRIGSMVADVPVIILTGHATLESAIGALRSVAHDYLLKPLVPHDLVVSVNKVLQKKKIGRSQLFSLNEHTNFDYHKRTVQWGKQSIPLTAAKGRLFTALLQCKDKVISHHDWVKFAQGYDVGSTEAAKILRPIKCRLRRKLAVLPSELKWIKNIRSAGYIFESGTSGQNDR